MFYKYYIGDGGQVRWNPGEQEEKDERANTSIKKVD